VCACSIEGNEAAVEDAYDREFEFFVSHIMSIEPLSQRGIQRRTLLTILCDEIRRVSIAKPRVRAHGAVEW